jgi:ABC-type Fe3+-hydroxamate transport system substrate-binding protein
VTLQLRTILTLCVLSGTLLAACAGTSSMTSSVESGETFNSVLVITIAGDYNVRSQFERVVVSNIRATGASASAWYSVAGGNKPVAKEDVVTAIQEQGFDAVLAIRRLEGDIEMKVKKSRTEIDATPIGGRIVNLFRSDYTDYKTPGSINFATEALLAVELYSAATEEIVFSFDHQTKKNTNLGLLIDQTAETIVKRIDREGLLTN